MGGQFYALLSPVWELRLGHEDQCEAMKCNLCGVTKPSHAFSPARQRARDYSTRRCKDCDFTACASFGTIPTQPQQKPYMCPVCQFPPCACGAPRPLSSQYRVSVKPTWQCEVCREFTFRKRADATDSDEASLQITKHLRLFLGIDMLVASVDSSSHKC